ncbi:MAG: trimethylamine methyltransferase family protein [Firmicutes bacterium]|nr:trimethylamine methyltransferase family protein [Bacillota bacterium]
MRTYELLTKEEVEQIHENSLRILEEVGMIFGYEPARDVLKKHGAKVDGEIVYFPRELVEKALNTVPSEFDIHSRNPKRTLHFDTETVHFGGPGGCAYVTDLDRGRRLGTKEDLITGMKLFQSLDHLEFHHVPIEMNDVDPKIRNKEFVYQTMKYSDKPILPFNYGEKDAKDCLAMAALPFGGLDSVKNKPVMFLNPCITNPLSLDDVQLSGLMVFAEYGQVVMCNSLCMAGATTPATLVGTVSVQNAEILAGLTLVQCINPGCPCIYNASSSISDMRRCSLAIGAVETGMLSLLNGQMSKYYSLPCRISGAITDSKCVDSQSAYESALNIMTAILAKGNFVMHAVGSLETYNTMSFEKVMIDNEVLGMVRRLERGVDVDVNSLAFDVIKKVGPRGQFVTEEHTMMNYRNEQYIPKISDRDTATGWMEKGERRIEEIANAQWKEVVANYVQPDFPAELDADMRKIVES